MNHHPSEPLPNLTDTLPLSRDLASWAAALSTVRPEPPSRIPGYRIIDCLGDGAYGSVWRAVEENTGKQVAIKFYLHRRGVDWSLLNREVERLASLYTCRDIISLLQVGWDADPPYYVMEYLENGSLERLLKSGPIPASEAVRIMSGVAQALMAAHHAGILHCDLKPANVLLDGTMSPRLADFGQSRLSYEQNPALGTLFYMAPEQADLTAAPSSRWDVYGFGALFHELLTGLPPHNSSELSARIQAAEGLNERLSIYRSAIREAARPQSHRHVAGVDSALADIIDRCLDVDPDRRFPDAAAIVQALDSRRRRRVRRPLFILSVLVPVILAAVLAPIAFRAADDAVRTAELSLAGRALESDVVTARILAHSLGHDLLVRRRQLEQISEDSVLRSLLTQTESESDAPNPLLAKHLAAFRETARRWQADEPQFEESWFVTDEHGVQLWRDPPSSDSTGKNYRYRDYFHGLGKDFPPTDVPADVHPIREPHISIAYRSTVEEMYKVAVTVPIWSPDQKQVIGVLGRSLSLGRLLREYEPLLVEAAEEVQVTRVLSLVDARDGRLLDHPWMTPVRLKQLGEAAVDRIRVTDSQLKSLHKLQEIVQESGRHVGEVDTAQEYVDPVSVAVPGPEAAAYQGEWLAAFWPVGSTQWIAVVQERRSSALQPVRQIRDGLLKYGMYGSLAAIGLVLVMWGFVVRALVDRRVRRSRRFDRRPAGGTADSPARWSGPSDTGPSGTGPSGTGSSGSGSGVPPRPSSGSDSRG
jgi:hypothetical protein